MRNRLILLPGWGLGCAPLEPLAAALQGLQPNLWVQIEPLPQLGSADLNEWLDELDANLPEDSWLGGWSLGGMLATELAARRGERCCGLITLASNACFVARSDWPQAMTETVFAAFLAGCEQSAETCLKRFSLLCAQGCADPRGLARLLVASAPRSSAAELLAGLQMLERMDTRTALQAYRGPQLHLLAAADALLPTEVAGALLALVPDVEIGLLEQASHAFVLERPHEVAAALTAFMSEAKDD
ncbi:MAG: alpha/beta fold hydrolase [Pseudomonas sp.]|nr:alpha/beta fold hydrolase [Pseudomonas sp.]